MHNPIKRLEYDAPLSLILAVAVGIISAIVFNFWLVVWTGGHALLIYPALAAIRIAYFSIKGK